MHLEYNYRNQMEGFRWWLEMMVMVIILYIILWHLGYVDMEHWKLYLFCAFMPYFLMLTVPMLVLHIRYYLRNRGQVIDILDDRLILTKQNGERKEYLFSEIDEVVLHRSRAMEPGGGYAMSPIDRYSYLKLEFKDFDELPVYITCFMHPDFDKVTMELKGVGMSIRRNVFL